MNLNQLAEWLGGQRLEGHDKPVMTSVVAKATGKSENGKVKVVLDGDVINVEDADGKQIGSNEIEIPTSAHVEEGDSVIITLFGGAMSKPLYTQVQGSGDRTYSLAALAKAAAEAADTLAGQAKDAADATNEHFFSDSNGIHVTTEESDASTGPNLLANSIGILLRDGTLIRTAQTASGFAVYDGLGNQAGNIVALLGDVITLGKTGEQQLVLDQDAFELLNVSGNPFFHVGYSDDAIDASGQPVTAPFLLFDTTGTIASRTIGAYSVAFGLNVAAEGAASLVGGSENTASHFCFSMGYRNTANGTGSAALGLDNVSDGDYSAAIGQANITKNAGELACGKYNVEDTTGNKLFSVGNGTANNARSDAFSVYNDGDIQTSKGEILSAVTLFESANGQFSGVINLSDSVTSYDYIEVLYRDADGVCSSVKIDKPAVGTIFNCSTQNIYNGGAGLAIKARTFEVTSANKIDCYNNNGWWSGQYIYNGSNSVGYADFIGVTKILGYR